MLKPDQASPTSGETAFDAHAEAAADATEERTFASPEEALGALADDEESQDADPTAKTEDALAAQGAEDDAQDGQDQDEAQEGDETLVRLGDGEEVALGELKNGYFRNKDYTQKTEALDREHQAVEAARDDYRHGVKHLQGVWQALNGVLAGLIPPEPDFTQAANDPTGYNYQLALRNNAITELNRLSTMRDEVGDVASGLSENDIARHKAQEDAKLAAAMPGLAEPARRAAFDAVNTKTAREFGFSEDEIGSTFDHRILRLVHYAGLGKQAEANRKRAGKPRPEKPGSGESLNPATARPATARAAKNAQAMKRLAQTGSFEAAMAVDFE
ncbi:MAG: hypothetical protein V6Z86_10010 [Hyphomicrobiales bacterium]